MSWISRWFGAVLTSALELIMLTFDHTEASRSIRNEIVCPAFSADRFSLAELRKRRQVRFMGTAEVQSVTGNEQAMVAISDRAVKRCFRMAPGELLEQHQQSVVESNA